MIAAAGLSRLSIERPLPLDYPRQPYRGRGVSCTAAAVALLLLSACSSNPPIISGDTSCERFRHISATPAQIKVFADNWEVMEPYADQIVSHNVEYDAHCLRGGE
jgi:hypothetical protein